MDLDKSSSTSITLHYGVNFIPYRLQTSRVLLPIFSNHLSWPFLTFSTVKLSQQKGFLYLPSMYSWATMLTVHVQHVQHVQHLYNVLYKLLYFLHKNQDCCKLLKLGMVSNYITMLFWHRGAVCFLSGKNYPFYQKLLYTLLSVCICNKMWPSLESSLTLNIRIPALI